MSDYTNRAASLWDQYQWLFDKIGITFNELTGWLDEGYDLSVKKPYEPVWGHTLIKFAVRDLHGDMYVMERPADADLDEVPDGLFSDIQSDELNDLMRSY